jgi:hypothetical protein
MNWYLFFLKNYLNIRNSKIINIKEISGDNLEILSLLLQSLNRFESIIFYIFCLMRMFANKILKKKEELRDEFPVQLF